MAKSPKRPRDQNQLAKLVVDIASGEVEESKLSKRASVAGEKGGAARSASLTPEQRSKIARAAAAARWKKD